MIISYEIYETSSSVVDNTLIHIEDLTQVIISYENYETSSSVVDNILIHT